MSVDGSSNKKDNKVGIILEGLDNVILEQILQFNFNSKIFMLNS